MYSFFYPPSIPFDICPAFEKIRPLISSLFAKETQLKNADAKPGTLAHQKYEVISCLCEDIRKLQNDFNQASKESNADLSKQLIATFANKLKIIINGILSEEGFMLSQHRYVKEREVARKVIDVGTHAAMILPVAILGSPVSAACMLFYSITGVTSAITTPIQHSLYNATGLAGKKAKSRELLNELASAIEIMIKDFKLEEINEDIQLSNH